MKCFKPLSLIVILTLIFVSCNIEPFEGEVPEQVDNNAPNASTCTEAVQNTADAAIAFSNVSPSDTNYSDLCSAYKKALQDQKTLCGDQGGAFQTLIDSLGDCGKSNETGNESGDYWPMSIGNSWTYTASVTGFPDDESIMEISSMEDYQGAPSYVYENFLGAVQATDGTGFQDLQVNFYTRKSNGEYQILVGEMSASISGLYKFTQGGYDYVILKDNVDVGTKWDYNFDVVTSYEPLQSGGVTIPNITSNYDLQMEILEKNASVVSGGQTYNSVIKVKFTQKTSIVGIPTSSATADYIYYFAKDIGIVKIEGTIFDADDNITSNVTQQIRSYVIK